MAVSFISGGFSLVSADNVQPYGCVTLNYNMRYGSRDGYTNGEVSRLQAYLNGKGYLSVGPTGYFGSMTLSAVQRFQRENNLYSAGYVGPQTRALIVGIGCVVNQNNQNQPVINGLDSPTTLNVDQSGTWTVHATDVTGGGLSYGVVWGDEVYSNMMGAYSVTAQQIYNQTSTFTHAYHSVGVFTPTFTVRGSNGQSAQTSASINVNGSVNSQVPAINSVSPTSGGIGSQVTIYGSGFQQTNTVLFSGGPVNNVSSSNNGTSLSFSVPGSVGADCQPGMMCAMYMRIISPGVNTIAVRNLNGTSNVVTFVVLASQIQL